MLTYILDKPGHHYKACYRFKEDCANSELKYDPDSRKFYRVKADEDKKDRKGASPARKRKTASPPRRADKRRSRR